MKELKKIKYWLFDLDNTLYSGETKVFDQVDKKMSSRAEVNDIYNSLEMGASALVLAGETAIGKYPIECVKFLINLIKVFNRDLKKK